MQEFFYVAIGFVVGVIFAKTWLIKGHDSESGLNPEQEQQKQINLRKVLELAVQHPEITNDMVEKSLGVSDATAERYLQEMEKDGKLVQVGKTGRKVIYKKS